MITVTVTAIVEKGKLDHGPALDKKRNNTETGTSTRYARTWRSKTAGSAA